MIMCNTRLKLKQQLELWKKSHHDTFGQKRKLLTKQILVVCAEVKLKMISIANGTHGQALKC